MFMTAKLLINKMQKQPKCTSVGECINTRWYIHAMQYYSKIKRNKYHATTWINFENTVLNERIQLQNITIKWNIKQIGRESRLVDEEDLVEEDEEVGGDR